jgi:hypothetical protein
MSASGKPAPPPTAAKRDKLSEILENYENRLKQAITKKQKLEAERSRFIDRFLTLCRQDWSRIFEEIGHRLGGAGHGASAFLNQERWQESLTLKVTPVDASGKPMETNCSIKMTANEASMRVNFVVMTADRAAHSSADEVYTIEELTPDKLRQVMYRQIATILDSVLPKE